jgi:hypothetical protein
MTGDFSQCNNTKEKMMWHYISDIIFLALFWFIGNICGFNYGYKRGKTDYDNDK